MKPITKEYFRKFGVLILIALFAWMFNYEPLKDFSYLLIILALLVYLLGPKTKIPQGAAYYSKILILDIIGFVEWTGAMIFFFFVLLNERNSTVEVIFIFLIFGVVPLFIIWYSIKLSIRWYLFTDDVFRWSDSEGVQSVALNDIELAEPYVKKKYVFSPSEMGMQITTKSGKKINVVSNNLEADEVFMKHLQGLYLAYDDTLAQYFEDGIIPEGDEMFNENLQKLQKRMEQ